MKYQISLYIIVLNIYIIGSIYTCVAKKNEPIDKEIIRGEIVDDNYVYNPNGFVNSPFGKVKINTKSFYKNKKLKFVLENRTEGYLRYSLDNLKKDTFLLKIFEIDTILKSKEFNFEHKKIINDTIFLKLDNKKILMEIN